MSDQTLWTKRDLDEIIAYAIKHARERCDICSHRRWDHGEFGLHCDGGAYRCPCEGFREDEPR